MPRINETNCAAAAITFSAIKSNGQLKDHINSAFLHKMLMYIGDGMTEFLFKRILYEIHYDRCDPLDYGPMEIVQVIASFQHWKDGSNHAIIRIYNAAKPQKD
jgi:hypothetical protein